MSLPPKTALNLTKFAQLVNNPVLAAADRQKTPNGLRQLWGSFPISPAALPFPPARRSGFHLAPNGQFFYDSPPHLVAPRDTVSFDHSSPAVYD